MLSLHCFQALAVEVDEMFCIIFSSRNGSTLEACAGSSGAAKAGGGSDEFHHFEGDLFIAAQGRSSRGWSYRSIAHGNSPRLEME